MIFNKNIFKKHINFLLLLALVCYFTLGCDKEVSTSPPDDEIPKAFLFIGSEPVGSSIYLNSKNTGRTTPAYVPFLEEGSYRITLKIKYYRDTTFNVMLNNLDTLNIFIDYFQNPLMLGKIKFTSSPSSAEIILNDSITGLYTPAELVGLTPGFYTLKYKILNYRDADINLIVESNKTTTAYEQLRDTSQWVDYQINNSSIQSNLLTSIAVDNSNIKWIGTSDLGLIRFDEVNFDNFNTSNTGIPSNQINCISISNNNDIWVGTNNGLGIYNGGSWQVYKIDNSGLPNNNVNDIEIDNEGSAWIGTNNGLVKFDGLNWVQYNYASPQFTYL